MPVKIESVTHYTFLYIPYASKHIACVNMHRYTSLKLQLIGTKSVSKDSRFWDKTAQKYSKQAITDIASYEHKLEKTREYLSTDSTVLEVGCGTGSTALIHAPFVKQYLGLDLSSEMISIANAKLKESSTNNLSFTTSPLSDFSTETEFDTVLALNVLHLIDDRDETIKQIYGLLDSNGLFISTTVCLADNLKFFKMLAPIGRLLGVFPLLRVFSQTQLKQSLVNNGFSIDYVWSPEKNRFGTIFIVARKIE